MSAAQWVFGGHWRGYDVNNSDNLLQFESTIPCKNDAGYFDARIAARWKVSNPVAFVKHAPDVHSVLKSWIAFRIRQIVDEFEPTQRMAAEAAVRSAFSGNLEALAVPGVEICHCDVMLAPDAATVAHAASLTAIRRERELDEHRQALWDRRREYYRTVFGAGFFEAVIFELAYYHDNVTVTRNVLYGREQQGDSGFNGRGAEARGEDLEMMVARERSAVERSLREDRANGFDDFSPNEDPTDGSTELGNDAPGLGDDKPDGTQS